MKSFLFNFLIFCIFILNNSFFSISIILFIFFIICIFYGNLEMTLPKVLILLSIIFTFYLNIFNVDQKAFFRVIELLIGFSFFPLQFNNINISVKLLQGIILYLFVFFIGNLLGIGFFQNFVLKYYPAEGNSWEILYNGSVSYSNSVSEILNQRLGSIYYNPNLLGQNLIILMIIYFLVKYFSKINLMDILFLSIGFLMIIGSGSRTAFIVFLIITFFYIKQFVTTKKFYLIIIPFLIGSLILIAVNTRLLLIFNQKGLSTDSMGTKHDILFDYLNSFKFHDLFQYIFGFLAFEIQFDYDIGNILYNFGFIGLFFFFIFLLNEYLSVKYKFKYFYCFLLISYGATLLINFKFFILTIFLLSIIRHINTQYNLEILKFIKNENSIRRSFIKP
jgi:hypothetical protein